MYKNIYLTYNEDSDFGRNTALRLQTISNLYGLNVFLPSRMMGRQSKTATRERIKKSALVVAFSLENQTGTMRKELLSAMELNKPIVVIYDKNIMYNLDLGEYSSLKEVDVDFLDTDQALHDIAAFLEKLPTKTLQDKKDIGIGTALIGIGLGLLALWALSEEDA